MKLRNILTILFITLFMLTSTTFAYTADTFSIEVGEDYEVREDDGLVYFQHKERGDNIVVQEIEQTIIGGKLTTYQLNSITEEITSQYKDLFDADVEQLGKEDLTINGINVTRLTFKTVLLESEIYQELNIFVYTDKIYDIIFTSITEEGFSDEEKSAILNSFEILKSAEDSETLASEDSKTFAYDFTNLELAWIEIGIVLIIAIILTIIAVKRNPTNKLYILAIIFIILQVLAIKGVEMQDGNVASITESVGYNIGFFIFAIIGIILLIIQAMKKPVKNSVEETKKEEVVEANEEPVKNVEEDKKEDKEDN